MATYSLLNRRRGVRRGTAEPLSPPNFVTIKRGSVVYALRYPAYTLTDAQSQTYTFPYVPAYGYRNNPPPVPALVPISTIASETTTFYTPSVAIAQAPLSQPVVTPTGPLQQPTTRQAMGPPFLPGLANASVPGTTGLKLSSGSLAISRITVLADSTNAAKIWVQYNAPAAVGNSFPLAAGAARDFEVNDLAALNFVGENATDKFYWIYER